MNHYLVTLDTEGALCRNSRLSHESAARSWGCQYVVLPAAWGKLGSQGAFAAKLEMDLLPLAHPCRVCWIDADTLIRADAPSPFASVPAGHIGGVLNYQGDTHADPAKDHAGWWDELAGRVAGAGQWDADRYINGGLMVFDLPQHAGVWQLARRIAASKNYINPMAEQTAVNVAIAATKTPLHILPHGMNRLGVEAWRPGHVMRSHIHHCANLGDLRGDKHAPPSKPDWRIVPGKTWMVCGGGIDETSRWLRSCYVAAANGAIGWSQPEWAWLSDPVAVARWATAANDTREFLGTRLWSSPQAEEALTLAGLWPVDHLCDFRGDFTHEWEPAYSRRRFSGLMMLEVVLREASPSRVILCGMGGYALGEGGPDDAALTRTHIGPFTAAAIAANPGVEFVFTDPPLFELPAAKNVLVLPAHIS